MIRGVEGRAEGPFQVQISYYSVSVHPVVFSVLAFHANCESLSVSLDPSSSNANRVFQAELQGKRGGQWFSSLHHLFVPLLWGVESWDEPPCCPQHCRPTGLCLNVSRRSTELHEDAHLYGRNLGVCEDAHLHGRSSRMYEDAHPCEGSLGVCEDAHICGTCYYSSFSHKCGISAREGEGLGEGPLCVPACPQTSPAHTCIWKLRIQSRQQ